MVYGAGLPDVPYEQPFGPVTLNQYAMAAMRHMHEFGTTMEQLAWVKVSASHHAQHNPHAMLKDVVTVKEVIESPVIADPLHLLDCSLVSDGGAAVIVTAADRAKDFPHTPIYLLGIGEGHSHEHISQAHSLTTSAAREAGERAYAMAGLGPRDMQFAQLYDCFTPTVLVELEDLGFCGKGEAGPFVQEGHIRLGGRLPVNTHGGLLSHCHPGNPGSMFALTESVLQLRGTAGARQVPGATVGLAHAQGGIMSSHATIILGTERH